MTASDQIPEYVGMPEIARWIGRTAVWVRCTRQGHYGPLHRPFPAPDALYRQSSNRVVPLWLPARRPEIEQWHREYLAMPGKHRPGQHREAKA